MPKKIFLFLTLATLLLASCAAAASTSNFERGTSSGAPAYSGEYEMPAAAPAEPGYQSMDYNAQSDQVERIVIKNVDLSLVVEDPARSLQNISSVADSMGGYVVNAQVYQRLISSGAEVPQANLTIRVPADRLGEALQRIEAEANRPALSKNINSQDVTSTYVDLKSRLRNLEAAEAQLQAIMNDARRTEEVLQVYSELTRVREQIEVIKGQIQYYDQASALSSISISLMADEAVQPLTIAGWEPAGVAKTAIQSLIDALQVVANGAIMIVLFLLPLLFVLLLPFAALILAVRSLRRKRTSMPPSATG
jgi:outer membrane biogenesis lipoprotein LolB